MKTKLLAALVMAANLLLAAGPLFGHHSQAAYEPERMITVTGPVTEFELVQPHSKIYFQVKDANGNVEQWMAQGPTPVSARRDGWNSRTIKPGDTVIVTGHPARNGSKLMNVRKLVVNGKVMRDGPPD